MSSFKDTRTLGAEQLRVFFEAVDSFLPTPASIVLIGGAAAALHGATSKIHRHEGLDFDTLVDRFEAEMRSAVGDPQRIGLNFLELIVKDGALTLNWDDEVVAKTCLTHGGQIKNEAARKAVEGA